MQPHAANKARARACRYMVLPTYQQVGVARLSDHHSPGQFLHSRPWLSWPFQAFSLTSDTRCSSLHAAGKDGKRVRDESTLQQAAATKPHLPDSDQAAVQRCWEECCPHRSCPARPVPSPERAPRLSEPLGSLPGTPRALGGDGSGGDGSCGAQPNTVCWALPGSTPSRPATRPAARPAARGPSLWHREGRRRMGGVRDGGRAALRLRQLVTSRVTAPAPRGTPPEPRPGIGAPRPSPLSQGLGRNLDVEAEMRGEFEKSFFYPP